MARPHFTHVPEAKTDNYMLVRPELVRRLGSATDALVLVRVQFRCDLLASHTHTGPDGKVWWSASREVLAEETGLTEKQVRTSLERLTAGGYLLVEEHRLGGNYDRTKSFRPIGPDTYLDRPAEANESGPVGPIDRPAEANPPLYEEGGSLAVAKKEEDPDLPSAESGTSGALFEEAWRHWPRKESKKQARVKFLKIPANRAVADAIVQHGDAHAQHSDPQFVPYLVTWLNQERWADPLPGPRGRPGVVDRARAADEILRQREAAASRGLTA